MHRQHIASTRVTSNDVHRTRARQRRIVKLKDCCDRVTRRLSSLVSAEPGAPDLLVMASVRVWGFTCSSATCSLPATQCEHHFWNIWDGFGPPSVAVALSCEQNAFIPIILMVKVGKQV